MAQALNKSVLIVIALLLNIIDTQDVPYVLPLLGAIIASSLIEIVDKKHHLSIFLIFLLSSLCIPYMYCYFPLLLYDAFQQNKAVWRITPFLIMSIVCTYANIMNLVCLLLCLYIGIIVKEKHIHSMDLLDTYKKQRDTTKELTILMQEKNQDLLLQQDYEVRLATLNERNRIAREIHDNVGHLLSSSLLQIGAIRTINKDEHLQQPLSNLKSTMDDAMSSVRKSVHDLHEDALNLEVEVRKIINEFNFAPVHFTYDIDSILPKDLIYHILAIVKECLHNVMKHSNGDQVSISMHEHPHFYQFIIHDNGTVDKNAKSDGIGLYNIEQRIHQYHGYLNINKEHGFRVFITLPKERVE